MHLALHEATIFHDPERLTFCIRRRDHNLRHLLLTTAIQKIRPAPDLFLRGNFLPKRYVTRITLMNPFLSLLRPLNPGGSTFFPLFFGIRLSRDCCNSLKYGCQLAAFKLITAIGTDWLRLIFRDPVVPWFCFLELYLRLFRRSSAKTRPLWWP